MTTGAALAAEARAWIGTPLAWGQAVKGRGCDCKMLVAGAAAELGLPEAESLPALARDYGPVVDERRLRAGLAAVLRQVREPQPGDVPLMRFDGKRQHLGIFTGTGVVHAYPRGGRHQLQRVIETPIATVNRAWPIDSWWRFPSLEAG